MTDCDHKEIVHVILIDRIYWKCLYCGETREHAREFIEDKKNGQERSGSPR